MTRKTMRSDVKTRTIEIKMEGDETKKAVNPKTVEEEKEKNVCRLITMIHWN